MKNKTNRKTERIWKEIEDKIKSNPDINISKLARRYKISRNSIYVYGKKRGWFDKQSEKKTLFQKIFGK